MLRTIINVKFIPTLASNVAKIISSKRHSHHCAPLTKLSADEIEMKNTVAKLASEQIVPYIPEMETEEKISENVVQMLFDNGLMGMEIDEEYGGSGLSFMTTILAIEEISKVDASVAVLVDIHNTLVTRFINKIGNPEQKAKYLTPLATKTAGSFCLTEPTSGSDAFSLKTTATLDGNSYVLNGTKMWISNSDIAGVFIVMANCDPSKGYKGITCFIVERDTPGLTIGKKERKLGIRSSGTCVVNFDNCRVPKENVLGEVGQGYKYAIRYLNEGRIGIGAQMVGLAQGCFDATVPYTLQRVQFKTPIFSNQAVHHQLARMAAEIEAARLLVYNAARLLEANEPVVKEAAIAKLYASEMAGRVTTSCIDLVGGVGFTRDFPQEKFFRDAKIGTIYEGTSNMMLHTIAKEVKKIYE